MPMRRRAKSMVAILDGDDDAKKLEDLCTLKYEHQAKWFINAVRLFLTRVLAFYKNSHSIIMPTVLERRTPESW